MKLFYKPGACSMASHIALLEIGQAFDIEAVDTVAARTASGQDFLKINPKGYVPALELGTGEILTEGPAILQFLADSSDTANLAPKPGTMARARMLEMLTFTSSELHKAFGPLFRDSSSTEENAKARQAVAQKFDTVEKEFEDGRPYVSGEQFSIADAYLFVVANWANFTDIDLTRWPKLSEFVARIAERPSVKDAFQREGF
ncbi:MAG: glutathione transferase GstA [Shimia sp.]|nr:glutathione transferase GstA [Shimia sp.]MCP4822720.1 glutathione transferase GstA [Shimia sp.]